MRVKVNININVINIVEFVEFVYFFVLEVERNGWVAEVGVGEVWGGDLQYILVILIRITVSFKIVWDYVNYVNYRNVWEGKDKDKDILGVIFKLFARFVGGGGLSQISAVFEIIEIWAIFAVLTIFTAFTFIFWIFLWIFV